jgi:hypothetical protein
VLGFAEFMLESNLLLKTEAGGTALRYACSDLYRLSASTRLGCVIGDLAATISVRMIGMKVNGVIVSISTGLN